MLFSEIPGLYPQAQLLQLANDIEINYLITDTRKVIIHEQAVLFAIIGERHDAHDYINDALATGIRSIVIERKIRTPYPPSVNVVQVDSCITLLQCLAQKIRNKHNYPVVGITGSNGKTVVKEWLSSMLSDSFYVVKSPASYNSQLGVALSVWQMSSAHNIGVFEAGISRAGEMEALREVIQPTIGIYTNLGSAHDSGFSSRVEKLQEKLLLFKYVQSLVYCMDHKEIHAEIMNGDWQQQKYCWSTKNKNADVLYTLQDHNSWEVRTSKRNFIVNIPFSDTVSKENLFHCITTLLLLSVPEAEIRQRCMQVSKVDHRLILKKGRYNCYLIDDTYNNDISGLAASLDYMEQQPLAHNKTVILSDILQSGLSIETLYHKVNTLLVRKGVKRLIGIGHEISKCAAIFTLRTSFFDSVDDFQAANVAFDTEQVLVKGARSFSFERIVTLLEEKKHGTVLQVNLENLIHNLNLYRAKIKPTTKIMVMVKAFAYGGGMHEIAHQLQFQKVDCLGVAYIDEGVELRKSGIQLPIMVMNPDPATFKIMADYRLEPELFSLEMVKKYMHFINDGNMLPCHIKIDTGMNRLGVSLNEIDTLLELIEPAMPVKSVFSHLSASDNQKQDSFTRGQAGKFEDVYQKIADYLNINPIKHLLNSSGIAAFPEYQYDMVRLGIGLYGFDASGMFQSELKVVSTLKTTISQIRKVDKGESIGYNRMGLAISDMLIAVVNIGYADGYSRAFSNGIGQMQIGNSLVPVIGNVCMDMTMLNITGVNAEVGDEVIVFGNTPHISALAKAINTIPYEILTNVSQRVKREFSAN